MAEDLTTPEIYETLGRCLSQWSAVEFGINVLFISLNGRRLRADDPLLASFEANQSFEAKRKMLRTFVISDAESAGLFCHSFLKLDKKISEGAKKRHEIAHFQIRIHHNAQHPSGRAMLHPFGSFTGSYFERDKAPLSAQELDRRVDEFKALSDRVFRFVAYVRNVRDLLERHEAAVDQPELLLAHPFVGSAPDLVTLG